MKTRPRTRTRTRTKAKCKAKGKGKGKANAKAQGKGGQRQLQNTTAPQESIPKKAKTDRTSTSNSEDLKMSKNGKVAAYGALTQSRIARALQALESTSEAEDED